MNRTVFFLSAAAFCALLLRPLQASWVIAPTVVAALSLLFWRTLLGEKKLPRPGKKAFGPAAFLAVLFAALFLLIWLRTIRLVSLEFFDLRKSLPLLITAIICAPASVPWLAGLLEAVSGIPTAQPVLSVYGQRLSREEKRLVFCCALVSVSICSLSSPLYAFNTWVDANCFMTVGKSMLYGIVPYRDLYEQKGPLLYALYAFCYLVSHRSFLGAWLLEILAAFFFLLLSCKTFLLFNEKPSALFIFLTAALTFTAPAFLKGGSAEELSLPLLMLACFYNLRAVRRKRELSLKECLFIGLTAGAVLWIKYSMLGFYVGLILVPSARMIREKKASRLLLQFLMILAGVLLASLPVLLYFALNGALNDLWTAYFYNNLFVYGGSSSPFAIFRSLSSGLASLLTFNDASVLLFLLGVVSLWREGERGQALHVFLCFVFAFGLVYAGGIRMKYYSEILCVFIPVGLAQLWHRLGAPGPELPGRPRLRRVVLPLLFTLSLFGTENNAMLGVSRADLPQYQFRDTVLQTEDPTLFNYGALDIGLFTVCDIVPSTRYFCTLNLPSEEMFREMDRYMAEGATDFIVSRGLPVESDRYRLVRTASFPDDGTDYPFYLYQKVDKETP